MAVVARAGQPLAGDRALLGPGRRLQDVEQPEAHGLLDLGVALQLDVGAGPEVVEVGALLGQQAVPARQPRRGQRRHHLVVDRGPGALARPAVGQVLDDPQLLARLQPGGDRQPADVVGAPDVQVGVLGPVDLVAHAGGHAQPALPGVVDHQRLGARGGVLLVDQRPLEDRGRAGVGAEVGHVLVGHQLGLQDDAQRAVDRLDLVLDGRDGPLGERHEARRPQPDAVARRRVPLDRALERAGPQVEAAPVRVEDAVADVERLVVDQQAEDLAVGHVDDRLARLGVPVAPLAVLERPQLVERVEVRAGDAVGIAFVEVAPQADVAVRQGEDRLGAGDLVEVELVLGHAPRLDREQPPSLGGDVLGVAGGALAHAVAAVVEQLGQVVDHDVGAVLEEGVPLAHPVDADDEAEATRPPGRDAGQRVLEHGGRRRWHARAPRPRRGTCRAPACPPGRARRRRRRRCGPRTGRRCRP